MGELDKALEVIVDSGLRTDVVVEKLYKLKEQRKVNYIFRDNKNCLCIDEFGKIENYYNDEEALENFNAFPLDKRKLVEYIAKKQKLERALLIYSDRHGAENIDWSNSNIARYYIIAKLNDIGQYKILANEMYSWSMIDLIYFNTREAAERAIEIYRPEIEEVLRLQRELYK